MFDAISWKHFLKKGILHIRGAVPPANVARLKKDLHQRFVEEDLASSGGRLTNSILISPKLADLIDHPSYIQYMYQVYGDSLKLLSSISFIRPQLQNSKNINDWHFDGPRRIPFNHFSPVLPLRMKVGVWLTDVLKPEHGAFTYIPGSHKTEMIPQYKTHHEHGRQKPLLVKAGDITIMHGNLWHRVLGNQSGPDRLNVFLEYGPAWLQSSDHFSFEPSWVERLSRPKQIILRNYSHPNHYYKPPKTDLNIFGDTRDKYDQPWVPADLRPQLSGIEEFE